MPDFEARFAGGVTLAVWTDEPVDEGPTTGPGGAPGRLNPLPGNPPTYNRGKVGVAVVVEAVVNGAAAPLDAALGGRLFTTHFAELPVWPPPLITSPAGQTSKATFTPCAAGHHLVVLRRDAGGAVALPFQVEP